MNISNNIRIRTWTKLTFYDPELILRKYKVIKSHLLCLPISEMIRSLRTSKLKKHKEGIEAALLCYGIGKCFLGTKVYYSPNEDSDYDFIAKWQIGAVENYAPVQLKELPPTHLNKDSQIVDIINGLSKYTNSTDTIIGIYLNRNIDINFLDLIVQKLNFAGIWLFGFNGNSEKLFIYGDLLSYAQYFEFDYPL